MLAKFQILMAVPAREQHQDILLPLCGFYKLQLFLSSPTFYFCLAFLRRAPVFGLFRIDKPARLFRTSIARALPAPVLGEPAREVCRDAGIQRPVLALQYIYEIHKLYTDYSENLSDSKCDKHCERSSCHDS